eukprot:scaffold356902_cov20-Prasinocladus_malaysianus.AAC.1
MSLQYGYVQYGTVRVLVYEEACALKGELKELEASESAAHQPVFAVRGSNPRHIYRVASHLFGH